MMYFINDMDKVKYTGYVVFMNITLSHGIKHTKPSAGSSFAFYFKESCPVEKCYVFKKMKVRKSVCCTWFYRRLNGQMIT